MSLWSRIADALAALPAGDSLVAVFDRLRAPPERSVGFTIAVIALGAKIAKADGRVTRDEVAAFRAVFAIPEDERANAARVYDLAREDVAGFEDYAARIARMFEDGHQTLVDLLEGLFLIAVADGAYHPGEDDYLARVGAIFGLSEREFASLRASFVPEDPHDPWEVLGIDRGAGLDAARAAWRAIVRECHPDRVAARGVPPEAVQLAERRLAAANAAWDRIRTRAA